MNHLSKKHSNNIILTLWSPCSLGSVFWVLNWSILSLANTFPKFFVTLAYFFIAVSNKNIQKTVKSIYRTRRLGKHYNSYSYNTDWKFLYIKWCQKLKAVLQYTIFFPVKIVQPYILHHCHSTITLKTYKKHLIYHARDLYDAKQHCSLTAAWI